MAKTKETEELSIITGGLPEMIDALESKIMEIISCMDKLNNAGLIYATVHWRKDTKGDPKYFYLLHPQKSGEKRRRQYVGRDAVKIEAAQAGIQRAQEYAELSNSLRSLRNYASLVSRDLNEAENGT
jgi:intergrase/recombinase